MIATRTGFVCRDSGAWWIDGAEPPACTDVAHEHQTFEVHVHRDEVELPDGTRLTAVTFDRVDPYAREHHPDHGLYLDATWSPPWPHDHVDWPDFGVPADAGAFAAALERTLRRARAGERIEVGCVGGHGRTGTALACLAVLAGHPPDDAVAWVRRAYCDRAVETSDQEALVATFGGPGRSPLVRPRPRP